MCVLTQQNSRALLDVVKVAPFLGPKSSSEADSQLLRSDVPGPKKIKY